MEGSDGHLRLSLLGRASATLERNDGERSVALEPKRMALLAFLARPRPGTLHPRDEIFALFWPEVDEKTARNALRQSLHYLRKELGEEILTGTGSQRIGLEPETVSCDAARFEACLEEGRPEAALGLYEGRFMAGYSAPDSARLQRWIEGQRTRLRRAAAQAAIEVARVERDRGDQKSALDWVRRARQMTLYDESLIRFEMRLLADMGDVPGAIRAYRDFRTLLRQDLEVTPSNETWEILQHLRGEDADRRTMESLRSDNESLEGDLLRSHIEHVAVDQFLQTLLSSIDAGVIIVDRDLTVLAWNRGSEELWGIPAEHAEGTSLPEIDIGLPTEEIREAVLRCVRGESGHVEHDFEVTGRRGVVMDVRVRIMPFVGDEGSRNGALLLVEEFPA